MADITLSQALGFAAVEVDLTTPGSGTWTHPEPGIAYELVGEIVGGGGGGASGAAQTNTALTATTAGGGGGSPGVKHFFRMVTVGDVDYVVGAGGAGGAARVRTGVTTGTTAGQVGSIGGDSRFGRFSAAGGQRGQSAAPPADGLLPVPFENLRLADTNSYYLQSHQGNLGSTNSSAGTQYGGRGGLGYSASSSPNGSAGVWASNANVTASAAASPLATDYGCGGAGGGAACVTDVATTSKTATSGAGSAGAGGRIRFYYRRLG